MTAPATLESEFKRLYGQQPRFFRAPGRVNLIGEHTDYNEGFVLPAAVEFQTRVAIAPADARAVDVFSMNFDEKISFQLDDPNPVRRGHWSDYVRGVAIVLERAGHRLRGAKIAIDGTVPIGSGLSSSAALEVACASALLANSSVEVERTEIARLCQKAENIFVGARTGIMDQFIACHARANHALLLDCRSLEMKHLPLPPRVRLVVFDTRIRHDHASGEYNLRREQCETGARALSRILHGIQSLRDATAEQLEQYEGSLDPVIHKRCRHVVTENARVVAAAHALEATDVKKLGRLMVASHRSLRDDYQVSCPELDTAVEIALRSGHTNNAVYGARMTGGGFGGSTVNLVEESFAPGFANNLTNEYLRLTGVAGVASICSSADGVSEELEPELSEMS